MAKISIDLMGVASEEVEIKCFTVPGPGVRLTIKTPMYVVEIDLPEKVYATVLEKIGKPEVFVGTSSAR